MGQKVFMYDDMDPERGRPAAYINVPIVYDGVEYHIDLSLESKEDLDQALKPFLSAARRIGKNGKPARPVMPPEIFEYNDRPSAADDVAVTQEMRNLVVKPGERWWQVREEDSEEVAIAKRRLRLEIRAWARTEGGWPQNTGARGAMSDEVYRAWETEVYAKDASQNQPS